MKDVKLSSAAIDRPLSYFILSCISLRVISFWYALAYICLTIDLTNICFLRVPNCYLTAQCSVFKIIGHISWPANISWLTNALQILFLKRNAAKYSSFYKSINFSQLITSCLKMGLSGLKHYFSKKVIFLRKNDVNFKFPSWQISGIWRTILFKWEQKYFKLIYTQVDNMNNDSGILTMKFGHQRWLWNIK